MLKFRFEDIVYIKQLCNFELAMMLQSSALKKKIDNIEKLYLLKKIKENVLNRLYKLNSSNVLITLE